MASEREARRRAYLDKTAAETDGLAARGAIFGGNAFSEVLLVKGELSEAEKGGEPPLSGADGKALRASLDRLGYAPEDWEWALTVDADGEPLDASLLRETVCALDPATLVCCDEAAANLAREAYADELALLDPSPRGEVLSAWLDFLSRVEQDGTAPFAETRVEGASDMLVALALVGSEARAVLSDYVPASSDLPAPGVVSSLRLDEIPALVACLPRAGGLPEGFLILVPPERARAIWRSLLSFGEIYPVGLGALRELLCDTLPWGELLSTSDVVRYSGSTLRGWSLVRNEGDFVGARELEP